MMEQAMKWMLAIVLTLIAIGGECAAICSLYSLIFIPCPPTHGEDPVFYLGIEIFLGVILMASILGAPILVALGVQIVRES